MISIPNAQSIIMKKYILLLFFCFVLSEGQAQDYKGSYKNFIDSFDLLIIRHGDTCKGDKSSVNLKTSGLVTKRTLNKITHDRFSKIVLENDGIPNEVSSAAFKIAEDKLKFTLNTSLINKKGSVIGSFGVSSDVAGNSSVIYSKGKLNTAFSINGRLSFLTKSTLFYSCSNKDGLIPKRKKLLEFGKIDLLHDSLKKTFAERFVYGVKDSLEALYSQAHKDPYSESTSKKLKTWADELDKWTKSISNHPGANKVFDNILDSLYNIESETQPWNALSFRWVSIFGSLQPSKYNLYYSPADKLIADSTFNGFKAGIDFNYLVDYTSNLYENKPKGPNQFFRPFHVYSRYHSLRLEINRTNNTVFFDTAQVAQKDASKIKAVKFVDNIAYETFYEATAAFKNILFFGENKSWGIEFTPRYTVRKKAYYNSLDLDAGLLFQLKDRDKEKSKVNFEFLFSFRDLTDNYKNNFPVNPDKFIMSFVGGIPLSSIFKGLF